MADARVSRTELLPQLLRYAVRQGVDVAPVLRRHQLPVNAAELEDVSVTVPVLRALGDELMARLGVDALELFEQGAVGVSPFRCPRDYAARAAPTLRAALTVLTQYSSELNGWATLSLEEAPSGLAVRQRVRGESQALGRAGNELSVAHLLQLVRALVPQAEPNRVWFAHETGTGSKRSDVPVPPARSLCANASVTFGAGENGFELPRDVLDRPLPSADPVLAKILERQVLVRQVAPRDFLSTVREQIRAALREGDARLEAVAHRLHMSNRTLQRKLGGEGVAYQEILGECQASLAETLLQDPRLTLGEVAYQVGYSDTRGLVRAFRRWKGVTPGTYRQGLPPERSEGGCPFLGAASAH